MAGFDPSVIASIGENTPDVSGSQAKAYTLADMMDRSQMNKLALSEQRQKAEDSSQVRGILKDADLSTYEGQLKAGEAITKVSPQMGMDFLKEANTTKGQQNELTQQQYQIMSAKNDVIGSAAMSLKQKHDALIQQGRNPAEVNAAMMPDMLQTVKQLEAATLPDGSPVLSPQDRQNYEQQLGKGYNPQVIDSIVMRSKQAQEALKIKLAERKEDNTEAATREHVRHDEAVESTTAATERERVSHDRAMEGAAKTKAEGAKYTDDERDMLASFAAKGITIPGGRSQAQIKATLDGLKKKAPDKSADEIADDIVSGKLKLAAETKGAQTAGTQIGKVALSANELDTFGDQVLEASKDIPRGTSVTLNGLMQAKDSQFSDPKLLTLKAKLQALNNAYEQLAARGGTDAEKRAHIHELFDSRLSGPAIQSLVNAVKQEAAGAREAADRTIAETSGSAIPGTGGAKPGAGAGANASPVPDDIAAILQKHGVAQ